MNVKTILVCAMALGGACAFGAGGKELTLGIEDGLPCELTLVEIPRSGDLAGFAIGKSEITQGQYEKVMGENPSTDKGTQLPVNNVTWTKAMEFCDRLNELVKRPNLKWTLPTSNQWQRVARTGEKFEMCGANGFRVVVVDTRDVACQNVVVEKLQTCDFLLNKDFKKDAKFYLCLFSASWCGPCRAEMPRIAKAYADTLKSDPDVELVHFSRDQDDEKAMAWAKEHDVKFPVVKPKGGNPLDLKSRGIPHLFIVKADGALVEEGHPASLFSEDGIDLLTGKTGKATIDGYTWSYCVKNGEATIVPLDKKERCAVSPNPTGKLTVPSEVDGVRVTKIGRSAFRFCGMESLTMPPGVTSIGDSAFGHCRQLTSVEIAPTVRSMGRQAFESCEELVSIAMPKDLAAIGDGAFSYCSELSSVAMPSGVVSIGDSAFRSCRKLASMILPKSVASIGNGVFSGCTELKQIDVETDSQNFASAGGALYTKDMKELVMCPGGLASVTLPASVCKIRRFAFGDCGGLKQINVVTDNPAFASVDGVLYTKDMSGLLACPGGLAAVAIPQGVKSIDEFAFRDCKALATVIIPSSVTSIGWSAFSGCSGLTSVTIPPGVTSLPSYAFSGCSGLAEATIPANVRNISHRAFGNCSGLKSVTISEGVKRIDSYAFTYCVGLTSMTIPASVTSVAMDAFSGCRNLASVTMCGECPKAPDNVFRNCKKLVAIHVPANAKSWAGMKEWQGIPLVFDANAEGVKSPEGDSKAQAGEDATVVSGREESATEKTRKAVAKLFPGWSLDTEVEQNDRCGFHAIHRGQANAVEVHPKDQNTPAILSRTVTLSEKNPCLFLKVATWYDDSDFFLSVRVNGKDALTNRLICTPDVAPWEDVIVPLSAWRGREAKIEIILASANRFWWEDCFLARVEIAEGSGDMRIVEGKATVDGYTWSYRAQNGEATIISEKDGQFSCAVSPCPVGHIAIPATVDGVKVTRLGRCALVDCSGLTSVTIPEGVVSIGREALLSCTGLRSVTIPAGVKVLEWDAFGNCNALASVALPEGLTNIERGAFYFCYGLTSIVIPQSVTHIGQDAFLGCKSLSSVEIPPNVTDIGWQTFRGCNALTSMTIPASVTNINFTAFCDCGAMTSFRVDEGNRFYKSENGLLLTKDGTTLVRGANGDVKIPSSVTAIGPCAFEGSVALRPVVIPSGVKSIGDYAFKQCRGMSAVTIPESVMRIGKEAFNNCSGLKSMTIPATVTNIDRTAFDGCSNLKSVDVVKDGKVESMSMDEFFKQMAEKARTGKEPSVLSGPYGMRVEAAPGCEKGAEYVLNRLVNVYLPIAVKYYGDPFGGKTPSRVFTIKVKRNDGSDSRKYAGPSWSYGTDEFTVGLAKGSDKWEMDLPLLASQVLTVCKDAGDAVFSIYVNDFVRGMAQGVDPVPGIRERIRQGLAKPDDKTVKDDGRLWLWRKFAPMWSVFEELREKHPTFILDYCTLKNSRYSEGRLPRQIAFDQMADLMGEATGENMAVVFEKHEVGDRSSRKYPMRKISVAQKLQECDFLLNRDFKKDAKYYLCLFSASWCGPCRAEMPRIATIYAETLKADPDIELIHFSRDRDDEKALAWAREHDVKFPVVKPKGGNPLDLTSRGIPHLFIVKADGTLVEEGHPMKLFTDEKLRALK